ncbi:Rv3235 family protein [Nocardiopsis trehalosi]|jgi:hypothetical protein|uniref:Rv3235 family protein n=1 Tax=Nocardiopsis trehalosi TaxID=109329 RepID=UPI00082A7DC1|nr:Rv3235 family protein [Nocardiopsis trehalosi]
MSCFAQHVAEVLGGQRAPAQLRHLLTGAAYELLRRRAGAYACRHRPRVRRALLRVPGPGVGEVSAVVDCGERCRALALRVAFGPGRWVCTHVETDLCR